MQGLRAAAVTAALTHNRRRLDGPGVAAAGAVALGAALVAVLAQRSLAVAVALALAPAVVLLLPRPVAAAVLGVGLLPLTTSLVPGGGLKVSASDTLLLLALLGGAAAARRQDWAAVRPVLPVIAFYALMLLPALAALPAAGSLLDAAQRLQIVLVPVLVGAVVLRRSGLTAALNLYVGAASVVGVLFGLGLLPPELELQKNPVGQFLAGALLILATGRCPRLRLVAVPALAYGLFATESRGAVLGLLAGLAALIAARPGAARLRTAVLLLPLLLVLTVAYAALPDDVQQRATTFVASDEQPTSPNGGQYTIRIREAYRSDAVALIRDHPIAGVGIGNYLSGNDPDGTLTSDPHNVLLLEAAEGGVPLGLGFCVLVLGASALLWRLRRSSPLVPLALALQASTVLHAFVDIYWVRGTPVMSWLITGAVLADVAARRARAS